MRGVLIIGTALLLQGCVASVVKDVVTAPIKIVSKTADVMTTSQSESDEKRGKEMRKREEALGKLARQRDKAREKCEDGDEEPATVQNRSMTRLLPRRTALFSALKRKANTFVERSGRFGRMTLLQ